MGNLISKSVDDQNRGIKINGVTVNNLNYADDTVILSTTYEDLQMQINRIVTVSEDDENRRDELSITIRKTKYMIITQTP